MGDKDQSNHKKKVIIIIIKLKKHIHIYSTTSFAEVTAEVDDHYTSLIPVIVVMQDTIKILKKQYGRPRIPQTLCRPTQV